MSRGATLKIVRLALEDEIERLIAMLDVADGDPDDEPDHDDGPSLLWDFRAEWGPTGEDDEPSISGGSHAAEHGDCDREAESSDDESSLGWPEQIDQERRLDTTDACPVEDGEEDGGVMPEEEEQEDCARDLPPVEDDGGDEITTVQAMAEAITLFREISPAQQAEALDFTRRLVAGRLH